MKENGIIGERKRHMRSKSPTSCQYPSELKLTRKVKTQNDVFHGRNNGLFESVHAKRRIYDHKSIKSNIDLEGGNQPGVFICQIQAG